MVSLVSSDWVQVKSCLKKANQKYKSDPTVAQKSEEFRKKYSVLSEIELMKSFTV